MMRMMNVRRGRGEEDDYQTRGEEEARRNTFMNHPLLNNQASVAARQHTQLQYFNEQRDIREDTDTDASSLGTDGWMDMEAASALLYLVAAASFHTLSIRFAICICYT